MNKATAPRIGIVGFIIGLFIVAAVSFLVIQLVVVDRDRAGCERRQPIFKEISLTFQEAAKTLPKRPPGVKSLNEIKNNELREGVRLREVLEHAHKEIDPRIVDNCTEAYPSIIPGID